MKTIHDAGYTIHDKKHASCIMHHASLTYRLIYILFFLLFTIHCSLFTVHCFAAEKPGTTITSDSIEHERAESIYTAKGSVKIRQESTTIEAAEVKYYENISDIFATGDVRYNDAEVSLRSERAEYNLDKKTGVFHGAEIFFKRGNLHVRSTKIERRSEKEYFLTDAMLTTCDAALPAWSFQGKSADVIIGDRFKAWDATFDIKGIPVLYMPYIWAPVTSERKTGFLTPGVGYSRAKGLYYRQPFFWAIDENEDATLILDWYSKRGLGEGIEYRYTGVGNVEGTHWFYHLHDRELDKDYYELRISDEKRDRDSLLAYMDMNLLSGKDFYREYSRDRYERIKRFLDSTAELSIPMDNSRLYLVSQYLTELKEGNHTSEVAQKLPEIGYVVNPYRIGPVIFSLTSSSSNFWREEGVFGQRIDVYPKFSYSFGDRIIISQNLGLRETMYFLHRNEDEGYDDSIQRGTFDYNITTSSRFIKYYASYMHAIEPSVGYTFIPRLKKDQTDLPVFDSTELYSRQSIIQFSVLNRILDRQGEFFTLGLSGAYDSYGGDRPFYPVTAAVSIARPIRLRGDTSYNPYSGHIESINSDLSVNLYRAGFSVGERYNSVSNTMFYDIGVNYSSSKKLFTEARVWYDAKGGGIRDATIKTKYQEQCWAMTVVINVRPKDTFTERLDDYSVVITFDLLGIGSLKI
ncbi:MAG: LPS-assembly protein LptD [Nitrospirae bacterium]|nr:LPS-assembly protein LptD [Nitrospirota bacterium]